MIQQRSAGDKPGEGGDRDGIAGDYQCPREVVGRADFSSGFSRLRRGRERKKEDVEGLQGLRAAVLSRKRRVWEECPASSPQQNPEAARSHESPRSHPETVSQTAAERLSFLPGPCMDSHPQQPEMATQGSDCGLSLA